MRLELLKTQLENCQKAIIKNRELGNMSVVSLLVVDAAKMRREISKIERRQGK